MISVAIQTHPIRNDIATALSDALDGVELCVDPAPLELRSPWRTYRHALERTPAGATHRVILQDDVLVCRQFLPTVHAVIDAQPDRLICLFVGGQPYEHSHRIHVACDRGHPFVELDNQRWCPCVALAWPVRMIEPFLAYVDEQDWRPEFRSDDEIIGRYLNHVREWPIATVPSLVEHPDVIQSLIGLRAMGGADKGRVAACWIHPDCDPASIDWTQPIMPL